MEIAFRDCGDCTACCDGLLQHRVYGNKMGEGVACVFLVDSKCSIYKDRPYSCSFYQCAWSQQLFPAWMKPNQVGVMISVELDKDNKQFLKIIELKEFVEYRVYKEIEKFVEQNNTYSVVIPFKKTIRIKHDN